MCKLVLPATESKMGQAEIHYEGSSYRINVLTKAGTQMKKGESGLIIEFIELYLEGNQTRIIDKLDNLRVNIFT